MGTSKRMIAEARQLLGMGEKPPGSNQAPPVTKWYGMIGPWCDMAVSYAGNESGNRKVVGKFAWTVAHARWARKTGRWRYGVAGIRPGDIVFYAWEGALKIDNIDHVGIIEARRKGSFVTLEGNVGNKFKRMHRSSSRMVGYFRPAYDDAASLPSGPGGVPSGEILERGDSGPEVRKLQQNLNKLGAHPALAVDGDFGPKTETAVKAFQRRWRLAVDGQAGPITLGAIQRELKGAKPPAG
jgi:hypothetical protein